MSNGSSIRNGWWQNVIVGIVAGALGIVIGGTLLNYPNQKATVRAEIGSMKTQMIALRRDIDRMEAKIDALQTYLLTNTIKTRGDEQ